MLIPKPISMKGRAIFKNNLNVILTPTINNVSNEKIKASRVNKHPNIIFASYKSYLELYILYHKKIFILTIYATWFIIE